MRQRQHCVCGDCFHFKSQETSTQTSQRSSSNRVSTYNGLDTNTPHRFETAERAGRRVKEGTGTGTVQSGCLPKWWDHAMGRYCCLRNVHDTLSGGRTPYENMFGVEFDGLANPSPRKTSLGCSSSVKRCFLESPWVLSHSREDGQATCSSRTAKTWKTVTDIC